MAYKALKNTVSVSMNKQGKIKYGAQVGYNKHNNDPQARQEHNKNVNPDLTQYNFNLIYLDGQLDESDMSDYDKFNRSFNHRANQRKKKDTMGRDIKIEGTNIARETIWYPPENLFDDCTTPQERAERLRQFADDLLPFLQDTFGKKNIIELSGHLDECKIYAGRPHLQLLTTNIICEGQEWEEKRKSRKKGASKDDKEVIKHSVGDVFGDTWFGGKAKCKRIKELYRQHLINRSYDVKFEDMTEEERLSTGVLYTSETDERSFQAHLDAKQDIADRETAVQAREIAVDNTEMELKKRKSDVDAQENAVQAREDDLTSREVQYQADLQMLVAGQQELREKQEKDEKDFQAREDKLEAQQRAIDEERKQLDERRERYYTPPVADEKIPPFKAKQVVQSKNEQIAYLQTKSEIRDMTTADIKAARRNREDAERSNAAAAENLAKAEKYKKNEVAYIRSEAKKEAAKIVDEAVKKAVSDADRKHQQKIQNMQSQIDELQSYKDFVQSDEQLRHEYRMYRHSDILESAEQVQQYQDDNSFCF